MWYTSTTMLVFFEATLFFIFGLTLGSFLNVIIMRLRSDEQWIRGRSHCMECKTELSVFDLIPLVSFIVLHGKCRYCAAALSWQYPIIELTTGLFCIWAHIALVFSLHAQSLISMIAGGTVFPFILLIRTILFLCILLIIFVSDFRWFAIYDSVVLFGSALALAFHLLLPPLFSPQYILPAWLNLLAAAAIPAAFFGIQYLVSAGRWIGSGDIILGVMLGFMLGYPAIIVALFIAYISGALVGITLVLTGIRGRKSEVPFGTFLTASTALMILHGDVIMSFVSRYLYS